MRMRLDHHFHILILAAALTAVSLGCSITDNLICGWNGGVFDPDEYSCTYPDSDSGIQDSSLEEDAAPGDEGENSVEGQQGGMAAGDIPAGTYQGEFPWSADTISTLIDNLITIHVSSDGTVSGEAYRSYYNENTRNTADGECTTYYKFSNTYIITGQISGTFQEPVTVRKTTYEINDQSPCGGSHDRWDDECVCEGQLTIDGNELKITCGAGSECGAYLTAYR